MTRLEDLTAQRLELTRQLKALDTLILTEAKPLWSAWLDQFMADCTLARSSSIEAKIVEFMTDRGMPKPGQRLIHTQLRAMGYRSTRRTDANYWIKPSA